jgi:site-specific DNA-methyltransferase (adenine-specific)
MQIERLISEYKVDKQLLNDFLIKENIDILKDGSIPIKYCQRILSFIETQDNRIETTLPKKNLSYISFDNSVKIVRDDVISFLRNLPANSIDLIVTDPAYSGMNNKLQLGKGRIVGKYSDKGKENGKWFAEFEDTEENYILFLQECKRVLKTTTGHIYIMFDSFSLLTLAPIVRNYFQVKNLITWDKVNMGMGHYYRRRHEYILFATNGNNTHIRNRRFPDVWRFKRIHNATYPTQKPVEVFQTMIYASTVEGYTVCDPFVGSGSAIIAALKNKCKFIGCDISEKSIEICRNRVDNFLLKNIDILQKNSSAVDNIIFWE